MVSNSDIFTFVQTTVERDVLLSDIEALKKLTYSDQSLAISIEGIVSAQNVSFLKPLLPQIREERESFLDSLKNNLASAEVLDLTLSFKPLSETIKKISQWVRSEFSPNLLVNIKVDPGIVAGSVIVFNGKYYDLSVKAAIESYFENTKEVIFSKFRQAK